MGVKERKEGTAVNEEKEGKDGRNCCERKREGRKACRRRNEGKKEQ